MAKFKRAAVCFVAVLGVFWLYKLTLAAWLVPPSVWNSKVQLVLSPEQREAIQRGQNALLPFQEHLFPPGAWERDKPIILESPDAIFLLRSYTNQRDKEIIQLGSCTIIFRSQDLIDYKNPNKRVTIVQAPAGADLEFDEPIDISRNRAGRIKSGVFHKQITVRSTPSKPGADDALNIMTSDVRINQQKMTTDKEVHGFLGKNEIFGTGLLATLLAADGNSTRGPSIGGVETVLLQHNVRMQIQPQQAGLLPGDRQTVAGTADASKPSVPQPPIDIRCQGAFLYSDVDHYVTFTDQVQLRRVFPNNQIDSVDAEWLKIEFSRRPKPNEASADEKVQVRNQATNSKQNSKSKIDLTKKPSVSKNQSAEVVEPQLGGLEPSKVIAQGQPVRIRASSSGMTLDAVEVEYNLFTGRFIAGKERTAVYLRQNEREYRGYTLVYEPGPNNSLGNLAAQGPGWIKTTMPRGASFGSSASANSNAVSASGATPASNIVEVKFQNSLTMQKIKPGSQFSGEHLISIFGDASIDSATTGHIEGDKIYLFLKELPRNIRDLRDQRDQQSFNLAQNQNLSSDRASSSLNVIPMRMQVLGEKKIVRFNTPQIVGQTKCLEVYFKNVAFENQLQNLENDSLHEQQNLRVVPFKTSENHAPRTRNVVFTAYQVPAVNSQHLQQFNSQIAAQNPQPMQVIYNAPAPVAQIAQNSQAPSTAPKKYINQVSGHLIRLQILQTEKDQKPQDITIDTEATFRQIDAANPSVVTTEMTGDHLEVRNAHDPALTKLTITGQPAVIKSPGIDLIGETVRVDYATNMMHVDGAGELNMTPSPEKNPVAATQTNPIATNGIDPLFGSMGNGPTKVKFPNGLRFDGERITIEGRNNSNIGGMQSRIDVVVTSRTERKVPRKPNAQNPIPLNLQQSSEETVYETRELSSPHIEVKLLSRIDFKNMNGAEGILGQSSNVDSTSTQSNGLGMNNLGAQVHTMTCTQGVFLQVREDHENGEPERYSQFHALDLVMDRTTDKISGNGPGEMVSYSRPNNTGRGLGLASNNAAPATAQIGQSTADSANPNNNEIDYMHIDFFRGFRGNIRNLEMRFDNNVVVVYGPVKGWSEKLDPNDVEKLTGNGFRMTSDELIVSQSIGNVSQRGTNMDLQAVGNTKIESPTYTANASRMTYTQAKNEVVLQGGRGDAVLYYYPKQGGDWSTQRAGTITFWPATSEVKIDNARQFEFSQPSNNNRTR